MKKLFAILGALFIVAAVILGQFFKFPGATVTEIALASFGLAAVIIGALNKAKEEGKVTWVTYVIIFLAVFGGIAVCVGGLASSIIGQIVGATAALLAIILGIIAGIKKE